MLILKLVRNNDPGFGSFVDIGPTALYGKAYIPAAKDTWHLLTDRGIDALINDSLVGISQSGF
jgi:hypothetical protein